MVRTALPLRIGHSETDMADRPLEDVVIKTIKIEYPEK